MRGSEKFRILELGEVVGSLAVKMGAQPFLLLFTNKALALVWPKMKILKSLILGVICKSFSRPEKPSNHLNSIVRNQEIKRRGKTKKGGFVYLDRIAKIVLKKAHYSRLKVSAFRRINALEYILTIERIKS